MPRQSPEAAAYAGTGSRIKPPADIVPAAPNTSCSATSC